jgi:hypothetical protein
MTQLSNPLPPLDRGCESSIKHRFSVNNNTPFIVSLPLMTARSSCLLTTSYQLQSVSLGLPHISKSVVTNCCTKEKNDIIIGHLKTKYFFDNVAICWPQVEISTPILDTQTVDLWGFSSSLQATIVIRLKMSKDHVFTHFLNVFFPVSYNGT